MLSLCKNTNWYNNLKLEENIEWVGNEPGD